MHSAPRKGFRSVTPRIVVADAAAEVDFLRQAFAATGELHDDRPAEVRIGDSLVMVTPAGPRELFPAFLHVYVDDADAAYGRALAAGAVSLEEPRDTPYGDRRAMVRDPQGNVWQIAHVIADRASRPPVRDAILDERFDRPRLDPRLRWLNEPGDWRVDPGRPALRVAPAAGTDFWQKTHYGFAVDNGHFLHLPIAGDFVLTTRVRFHPVHQYDQAGLMVRLSPDCWLKTSVEHEPDGDNRLGAVVTNHGYSDWSTQALDPGVSEMWFRVHRAAADYTVDSSPDGERWVQIRLARLLGGEAAATVDAGLYACSPKGSGFVCEFLALRVE